MNVIFLSIGAVTVPMVLIMAPSKSDAFWIVGILATMAFVHWLAHGEHQS